ncbi:MAG: PadR family transcriptional regulator [Microthrixaceae bacterium]
MSSMSPIRLLVLGVVRIFGSVHGYDVRRELLSWQLEAWVNVQTGSIYSALKTLEKDGLIAVSPSGPSGNRPARTEYELTAEGEKAFVTGLRSAWWQVQQPAEPLMPALCLMVFMERQELIAALGARANQLRDQATQLGFQRDAIQDGATGADGGVPEHVREILDFAAARVSGELDWTRTFRRRLQDGEYRFATEVGADEWQALSSSEPADGLR